MGKNKIIELKDGILYLRKMPLPPSVNRHLCVGRGGRVHTQDLWKGYVRENAMIIRAYLNRHGFKPYRHAVVDIGLSLTGRAKRRDIDNCNKATYDLLEKAGVVDDDCNIFKGTQVKAHGKENYMIVIVSELEESELYKTALWIEQIANG